MRRCFTRGRRASRTAWRRGASHDSCASWKAIVPHAPASECISRRSASQEDAERPERHGDAERRTIVALVGRLSFRTLQRRNAFRDALRRKKGRRSVPCC
ncbi:hypothetical protein DND90_08380 [Pseudomonas syringae pv. maculicola]|nr:hypothetical protein DND90_08380 [Pseudomonas syringae pv. maculicola]